MGKPELGAKHVCEACAERFYDLNRSPVVCFKCGVEQAPPKPRMTRVTPSRSAFNSRRAPPVVEEKIEAAEDDGDDADVLDADDDDDDADLEIEVGTDEEKAAS